MIEMPSAFSDPPPHHWWDLHVHGDLDLATAPDLDARLARALSRHADDGFVLDLSRVTFMDCAGLGPLLRGSRRIGDRLCLRGIQPRVGRLIDLTGVARVLRVLEDGLLWPAEAEPWPCRPLLEDLVPEQANERILALVPDVAVNR
jgi:anti-anti-sigma factor